VDKLGGVYQDIDHRYLNDNSSGGPTYATIDLHSGYQELTGKQALDFVRFRHTDSDIYRVVRQQEFVKAFKQQVSANFSLTKIPGIVKAITENVEVGVGGHKALDFDTLYSYAKLIYGLPTGHFQQVQLEGLTGYNELSADPAAVTTAVDKFLNPDVSAPEKAADAALGRKAKRETGPPPSEVTIGRCRLPPRPARLPGCQQRQRQQLRLLRVGDPLRPRRPGVGSGREAAGRPLRRRERLDGAAEHRADHDAPRDRRRDLPRDADAAARFDAAARAAGGREGRGDGGALRQSREAEGRLRRPSPHGA
jgi:hypothetical protein